MLVLQIVLKEIRLRFSWSCLSFLATFFSCYHFAPEFLYALIRPVLTIQQVFLSKGSAALYAKNIAVEFLITEITEIWWTYIYVSAFFGAIFWIPVFVYEIWCFFIPGFTNSQRLRCIKHGLLNAVLLIIVLAFVYWKIIPICWWFLTITCESATKAFTLTLSPKISAYSWFVIRFMIWFGLFLEIPWLSFMYLFSNFPNFYVSRMVHYRHVFWLFCLILASFIAPPDVIAQITLTFPFFVILEILTICLLWRMTASRYIDNVHEHLV